MSQIWVMEKPGGELGRVAEASHLGLGRVGAASPWRQHLEAPLESLTAACVHTCVHPGPRAHTCTTEPTQSLLLSEVT